MTDEEAILDKIVENREKLTKSYEKLFKKPLILSSRHWSMYDRACLRHEKRYPKVPPPPTTEPPPPPQQHPLQNP